PDSRIRRLMSWRLSEPARCSRVNVGVLPRSKAATAATAAMPASRSSYTTTGPLDARGDYRLTAKTQITPPCGTSVLEPRMSSSAPCMRCASTPQPDCTATYCTPSTAKELGTPVMPEFVRHCQSGSPVLPSNARKYRSLVPPAKTSPLPVVKIGPQLCDSN